MSQLLYQLFDGKGRSEQQTLPGARVVSHSNLGKELEDALNRTHHRYAIQKLANIKQNPKKWDYAAKSKYEYLANQPGAKATVAKTPDGRFLQCKKSDIDFSGNARELHVAFDAKQSKGKSFPLKNVERHQCENLLLTERTGAIAGLMIWMSELGRVFFVRASYLNDCFDAMLFKQGRSSISLAQLEAEAIEIHVKPDLREVDWLPWLNEIRHRIPERNVETNNHS